MIVAIDQNICTGCRECAEVCPAYAIVGEQGKPQTIDTDRCVMCGQCVQKCKSYVSVLTHGKDAYERVKKKEIFRILFRSRFLQLMQSAT
jgi:4Fe-4S binding domain